MIQHQASTKHPIDTRAGRDRLSIIRRVLKRPHGWVRLAFAVLLLLGLAAGSVWVVSRGAAALVRPITASDAVSTALQATVTQESRRPPGTTSQWRVRDVYFAQSCGIVCRTGGRSFDSVHQPSDLVACYDSGVLAPMPRPLAARVVAWLPAAIGAHVSVGRVACPPGPSWLVDLTAPSSMRTMWAHVAVDAWTGRVTVLEMS